MTTVKCFCEMALSYVCDGHLGLPWSDVIIIWYLDIVICTLVTIFNWWLSSKDMKLRVLIKKSTCSLSLTHVLHNTSLFTCERALSTVFGKTGNSRIIKHYIYFMPIPFPMGDWDQQKLKDGVIPKLVQNGKLK